MQILIPFELKTYSVIVVQYNTVKPKKFKPNLLDEPKDISSPELFFSLFLPFLNQNYLWTEVNRLARPLEIWFNPVILYII